MKTQSSPFSVLRSPLSSLSLALLLAGGLSSIASAQTLFNESFGSVSYSNGNLVGQNGWAQFGLDDENPVQVFKDDNIIALGANGQDVTKSFTSSFSGASGGSIQASLNLTIYNATTSGDYFFALSDSASYTGQLYARAVTGGYVFGFRPSNGGSIIYGTTPLTYGLNYTVSLIFDYVSGTSNDGLSIDVGGVDYLSYTSTFDFGNPGFGTTSLNAVRLRQGSSNAPAVEFSSISVTAVPEPSTYGLVIGAGLVALIVARRCKSARV